MIKKREGRWLIKESSGCSKEDLRTNPIVSQIKKDSRRRQRYAGRLDLEFGYNDYYDEVGDCYDDFDYGVYEDCVDFVDDSYFYDEDLDEEEGEKNEFNDSQVYDDIYDLYDLMYDLLSEDYDLL